MVQQDERERETEEHKKAQQIIDMQIQLCAASYDKAIAYTNLLIIAGYAGYFAMWSYTKENLSEGQVLWSGLAMTLSVASFVLFEVYKMCYNSWLFISGQKAIMKTEVQSNPDKLIEGLQEIDKQQQRATVKQTGCWIVSLAISLFTGITALAILVYGFVVGLIHTYST